MPRATPARRAERASSERARGTSATTSGTPSAALMGRLELVSWLNRALRADYAAVSECADGVAYCQLLDALHPGSVPLHRLDFNARSGADNERNVRVLERAMRGVGLAVDVDFEALASGTFSEHNKLLRWFHAYVEKNGSAALDEYDAYAARVRAQRIKAHASVRRRGEGATPLRSPADGARASGSEIETMNDRLVPNDLSAMTDVAMTTPAARGPEDDAPGDGDASFEFAPASEGDAPGTPRALSFPDTPDANAERERASSSEASNALASTSRRSRALDRWATKARAKLEADSNAKRASTETATATSEAITASEAATEAATAAATARDERPVETIEETVVTCCGCRTRRVVRRVLVAAPG